MSSEITELEDRMLTEKERYPLLQPDGRKMLDWLIEHPSAPNYNHHCGDRLTSRSLQNVRNFELSLRTEPRSWTETDQPDWISGFVDHCLETVPFYRKNAGGATNFLSMPAVDRADLCREPWSFVPDTQSLGDLIMYASSGTTGHPIKILADPEVSSKYLVLLKESLSRKGIDFRGQPGKVALAVVCAQSTTYTFASISTYLNQAGCVKVNLNPAEWRHPSDRQKFLDACNPDIYSGDPVSFLELTKLPLKTKPRALVSTAMKLLPGWRSKLESHFGCPVIDLYSMNECRLIAVADERAFIPVSHDLYVEILDLSGNPCPAGIRGEITLTCGRNPFLPLLRYRTGDYGSLEWAGSQPQIVGLEGRAPTIFLDSKDQIINNIDISSILYPYPISQFSLHQFADRSVSFKMRSGGIKESDVQQLLQRLFGREIPVTTSELNDSDTTGGKIIQYTSDIQNLDVGAPESFEFSFQKLEKL